MNAFKNDVDHEIRNGLGGIALEVRQIIKSMKRLEEHLNRIDNICKKYDEILSDKEKIDD